jgi:RNA methyltransferase, TrmH family
MGFLIGTRAKGPSTWMDRQKAVAIDEFNHPLVREILSLRDQRARDRTGLFFCEGPRFLIQAAAHNAVERVIVTPAALGAGQFSHTLRLLRRKNVETCTVDARVFSKLSLALEPSGVGLIARQRWHALPTPRGLRDGCWIAFDRIQSPGNLGTIVRTCDAVAASGAVIMGPDVDPYDPGCVRASMGSIFSQGLIRSSWPEMRAWATAARVLIVGTSPHAERDFREVSYRRPVVLAMGCERQGLSAERMEECDVLVRIPMVGTADSLNVAVAASVLLYEVFSQRRPARPASRVNSTVTKPPARSAPRRS